jgi:hypothetical protein
VRAKPAKRRVENFILKLGGDFNYVFVIVIKKSVGFSFKLFNKGGRKEGIKY